MISLSSDQIWFQQHDNNTAKYYFNINNEHKKHFQKFITDIL